MFNKTRMIDTMRRSSQRRTHRRISRIQRQFILETVVSNLCHVVDPLHRTDVTSPLGSFASVELDERVNVSSISA
ncbi:unnamed protein product [Rotaria socialis]|uniref:Uncharacterized protein n=1 Tax=Rotaria socialis TaxID=392032 RepID=A0A821R762_9BILA|nr:unnamed protein product [Rotaria socialis]